jgi:hypothetical protein
MNQITNEMDFLSNFVISRVGNNLIISAHGSGTGTSWTYDATINYTSAYVLSSMSEDHFATDGENDAVQNVLWTNAYHHSSSTTPPPTPGSELLTPLLIGGSAVVIVGVVIIVRRR